MLALIGAIFTASLLGSLHCAGMCGAFVAFAVGAADENGAGLSRAVLHAAYNAGRLITYVLLGVLAGAVGSMVNLGGAMIGVQRVAALLAGAMMVGFGIVTLARLAGIRVRLGQAPAALQRIVLAGHRASASFSPVHRAAVTGLLTTLLPCGWLWAFVITAAGTGSAMWGGLAMAAFWAGTLPILVGLGVGIQQLAPRVAARLPLITAVVIVAVGMYTIVTRASLPTARALPVAARSSDELKTSVETIDHTRLPCCQSRPADAKGADQ